MSADLPVVTTTATPTKISTSRVVERASKRLGWCWVGICTHCNRCVIVPNGTDAWVHRDDREAGCKPVATW